MKMIPKHPEWSTEIAQYARFILDDTAIRRNWFDKTNADTSISGPSELIEQIFVDLVADEGLDNLLKNVGRDHPLYKSISRFVADLNRWCDVLPDGESPGEIEASLRSAEWQAVRHSAALVLQAFN